jgi:hypothetical protein
VAIPGVAVGRTSRIGVIAPGGVPAAVGEGCGWTVGVDAPEGETAAGVGLVPGDGVVVRVGTAVGDAGCAVAGAVGGAGGDPAGVVEAAGPLVATGDAPAVPAGGAWAAAPVGLAGASVPSGYGDGTAVGGTGVATMVDPDVGVVSGRGIGEAAG